MLHKESKVYVDGDSGTVLLVLSTASPDGIGNYPSVAYLAPTKTPAHSDTEIAYVPPTAMSISLYAQDVPIHSYLC